jgi:hypothetical protein
MQIQNLCTDPYNGFIFVDLGTANSISSEKIDVPTPLMCERISGTVHVSMSNRVELILTYTAGSSFKIAYQKIKATEAKRMRTSGSASRIPGPISDPILKSAIGRPAQSNSQRQFPASGISGISNQGHHNRQAHHNKYQGQLQGQSPMRQRPLGMATSGHAVQGHQGQQGHQGHMRSQNRRVQDLSYENYEKFYDYEEFEDKNFEKRSGSGNGILIFSIIGMLLFIGLILAFLMTSFFKKMEKNEKNSKVENSNQKPTNQKPEKSES